MYGIFWNSFQKAFVSNKYFNTFPSSGWTLHGCFQFSLVWDAALWVDVIRNSRSRKFIYILVKLCSLEPQKRIITQTADWNGRKNSIANWIVNTSGAFLTSVFGSKILSFWTRNVSVVERVTWLLSKVRSFDSERLQCTITPTILLRSMDVSESTSNNRLVAVAPRYWYISRSVGPIVNSKVAIYNVVMVFLNVSFDQY